MIKNGDESMVVMSLETYSKLVENVEVALDEADRLEETDSNRLSHEDVFGKLRRRVNEYPKV